MPAGTYRLHVEGYQFTFDGVMHGEILYRPGPPDGGLGFDGGGFTTILSADGHPPDPDAGSFVYFEAMQDYAAITATCGDTLLVRLQLVSGTSALLSVVPELDIP